MQEHRNIDLIEVRFKNMPLAYFFQYSLGKLSLSYKQSNAWNLSDYTKNAKEYRNARGIYNK